ncbi:MAG: DUF2325 domain-containing protein [bacterium]|nr:DUF2325 domain-containing protein [bacterium]
MTEEKMKDSMSLWDMDCIMICTIMALSLNDKEIKKICRKYNLLNNNEKFDPYFAFYTLHHAAHDKDNRAVQRLERDLNSRYSKIINEVRSWDSKIVAKNSDKYIKNFLDTTPPGGAIWALLTDSRFFIKHCGIYNIHKILLSAIRNWKKKESSDCLSCDNREEIYKKQLIEMRKEITSLKSQLAKEEKVPAETDNLKSKIYKQEEKINDLLIINNKLNRELRLINYKLSKDIECQDIQDKFQNKSKKIEGRKIIIDIDSKIEDNCSGNQCNKSILNNCPLENLKIAVIGGLDRLEGKYKKIIESMGGEFMFHKGKCNGEVIRLKNIVCRSDIVIFITSINSHNAMHIVKGTCSKNGKTFCVMRETSPNRLGKFLINNLPKKKLSLQR